MDLNQILFLSIVVIFGLLASRIVLVDIKFRKFIKKNYPDFWDENIHLFIGGGSSGGTSITELSKRFDERFDDNRIKGYQREWKKALKQFVWSVVFLSIVIITSIYFGFI